MKTGKVKEVTICGIFTAMALVLSYMERFLPLQLLIPLPGMKLGLANIVTLPALFFLGRKSAFTILIIRCLLGSLLGGGMTALCFSLTGGVFSMTMMGMVWKSKRLSIYGISILGAAAHNIGQILAAVILMKSIYITGYLSYLLVVSVFTGMITGSVCVEVFRRVPYVK